MELNAKPVPIGVNVKGFLSADSEEVVTGGVLGGLPKVKPTGLPRLPPEVAGVVVADDAPNVNFVPVDGNPPNGEGDGAGLSLSEPAPPKILVVEDVEVPNPPNGLVSFSVLVLPNPPNTLVVLDISEVLYDPKGEGTVVLSFSLSSLSPNTEAVDDPPNKFVEEEDPPKRDPEDVELEVRLPNNDVDFGMSFGGSSVVLLAREEAKKFGMVEEGLLSESVVPPKPNVGAGGPPEDSEVGVGVEYSINPVGGLRLSVAVGGVKPLGFEPREGVPELAGGFGPEALGGVGMDSLGADVVVDEGAPDKLGALNKIDGPGSGPSGSVFLGELLKEPVSCLSHTDWIARRLTAYWSKTWERSMKGSSLMAFVRKVTIEWFNPRMLL